VVCLFVGLGHRCSTPMSTDVFLDGVKVYETPCGKGCIGVMQLGFIFIPFKVIEW